MKRAISRRAILRGAGGVALGLPLLDAMGGRALAQVQPPKRLVVVSVGHSVDVTRGVESWLPKGDFTLLSPILAPLIPHQARLLVLAGIDNTLSSSGIVPSNGHNYSSRSLLTGMPTKQALDPLGNLLANRPECTPASAAGGPSIEYVKLGLHLSLAQPLEQSRAVLHFQVVARELEIVLPISFTVRPRLVPVERPAGRDPVALGDLFIDDEPGVGE